MPNSRSKYSDAAVSRRKNTVRDVLLGVLAGLAVFTVVMAGRFIYNKSKNPDYRVADLFGTAGQTVLPAATLPVNPLESLTVPSSAESEPVSTAVSTEDTTEAPAEETTTEADTTEVPETTAEPDTAEVPTEPEGSTDEPSESSSGETAEPSETDDTAGTAETTPEETSPEETTEAPVIVVDPTDINFHLVRYNMTEDDLGECRQLIVVQSNGTQCTLYFFDKGDDGWAQSEAIPSAPGVVGRNGVTTDKKEGDGCTPAGYYALGPCCGESSASPTAMEYHQIVYGDYWVDDPSSAYYNQLFHLDEDLHVEDFSNRVDWRSAENLYELMRYYRYMAVIRYNMDPIVPGAGSAIFLHCQAGDSDTSGCVSTKEATVFAILRWLTPDADPHILIY